MSDNRVKIPTISIVTPSYNQGPYLAETLESVISQEGDFIIDYIIVDGGSRDDSVEIIKRYDALLRQGEWPVRCQKVTFRWISETDGGQTDALMKGFRMATGDILAWLNSDDTYLPGALQTAASFLSDNPDVGLMYGDACYCDQSGTAIGRYGTGHFNIDRLAATNMICQPAAFLRKDALDAVGGLDKSLQFAMDYDLWIRVGRRFPCHHVPRLLATYRLHDSSKTISSDTLYKNCEESLAVTIRHFGWAPLTRIYTSCRVLCQSRLPVLFRHNRLACAAAAIVCSIIRSLHLNRGIHRNDLKLLNRGNFRKLLKSRVELMTGHHHDNLTGEP